VFSAKHSVSFQARTCCVIVLRFPWQESIPTSEYARRNLSSLYPYPCLMMLLAAAASPPQAS
jgi:hypothetical protein